jgi:hypothetical protein
MQKLRLMPPPEGLTVTTGIRPESLVSAAQLRQVFKLVMKAMYRQGGLGDCLEAHDVYRGADDRRLLDEVMFWAAREIGVDFDASAPFNEDPRTATQRLSDRADGLVVAMSAAANPVDRVQTSPPPLRSWADSVTVSSTWLDRHLTLGAAFQRTLERGDLPVLKRRIRANDIVVWRPEPKFPRLVTDVAPKKASLIEPGDGDGAKPLRIHSDFLAAIDIAAIRETAGT